MNLRKTIEDWNKFVEETRYHGLSDEAKRYLSWHVNNRGEPVGHGKGVEGWTDDEIVSWYREAVK
jgi:hypothetical protein